MSNAIIKPLRKTMKIYFAFYSVILGNRNNLDYLCFIWFSYPEDKRKPRYPRIAYRAWISVFSNLAYFPNELISYWTLKAGSVCEEHDEPLPTLDIAHTRICSDADFADMSWVGWEIHGSNNVIEDVFVNCILSERNVIVSSWKNVSQ